MMYINNKQIENLHISPLTCIEWVTQSFQYKYDSQLPAKMSVHPDGNDFITTMPCLLPSQFHTFGVKVVSRIYGRKPSLKSNLMLYNSLTGNMIAMLDADWITSMRTGAVAALAIKMFRNNNTKQYSFIGLGNTARSTMKCLLEEFANESLKVKLLRYKDQAEKFVNDFSTYSNVSFEIVENMEDLVGDTDVLVSCITDASGLLVEDISLFKPGVLLVPIHTRGFQNCDLFFDKIFADDTAHVRGFKYFNQFKSYGELGDVLTSQIKGRETNEERIISYNIGLGLHDVYFSYKICNILYDKLAKG